MAVCAALALAGCRAAEPPRAQLEADVAKRAEGLQVGEEREIGGGVLLKMHAAQVSAPLGDGWHRATSREGAFTVELPLPYNDARLRAQTSDGVELRTHVIGAKTPGLLSWSASCMARKDGKLGPDARAPGPERVEVLGDPPKAHQRLVEFADAVCTLVVEAQGTDPLPPEADRLRFLSSLRRTGAPTW